MRTLLAIASVAGAFAALAGDQFYWWQTPVRTTGYDQNTFSYSDPANWSLSASEYSNPDGRIPGADDLINTDQHPDLGHPYYYYYGGFDLGGETRTIAGFRAANAYHCTRIDLTNGTFIVTNPSRGSSQAHAFFVKDGGVLIYPETETEIAMAPSGMLELWDIAAGGRGEMYAKVALCGTARDYVCYMVHEGGTMVFAPKGLNTTANNYGTYGVLFENQGTMEIPQGINWDGASYCYEGDTDRMRFRQTSGRMLLGGAVRKTARNHTNKGELTFELAGGTLAVSNSVSFFTAEAAKDPDKGWGDQVFAEMPANAAATVEVLADSSIDMSVFTFGDGAELVKTGPGKLGLKANNRPATLTISEGVVALATAASELAGVTFANGVTLEFDAPGNTLAAIDNAANLVFTVGGEVQPGDTVLTTDAATAQTVAANFVVPASLGDCEAVAEDGQVILKTFNRLTLTVCDFTQLTGTAAQNAGVAAVGLLDGDTLATACSGTLVYNYGGYTEASAAGTYVVSVSGLSSDKYRIFYVSGTMTAIDAADAATFYWKGAKDFASYVDIANWSLSSDLATPATRLPCEADKIFAKCIDGGQYWYNGSYDLGGGSYSIAGFDSTGASTWKQCTMAVRNGSLSILNSAYAAGIYQAMRYDIDAGGAVIYPYSTSPRSFSPSALQEQWIVRSGGRGEIYNYQLFCGTSANRPTVEVEAGGVFIFDPYGFGSTSCSYGLYGVYFWNKGRMELPHGINWSNKSDNAERDNTEKIDRIWFRQTSGTMVLGGDVCKTALNKTFVGRLTFTLEGGTLEVTDDVRFYTDDAAKSVDKGWGDQVFAEMPENANANLDVKADATFDMTVFTYGANAQLTKVGPGRVKVGAVRPSVLNVSEGEVAFMSPISELDGVTLSDGATVVFGALGNSLAALDNADQLHFTVDEGLPIGQTVFESSDPALVNAVFANMTGSSATTPAIVGGKIVLRSKTPAVVKARSRTILVGAEARCAGYEIVSLPLGAAASDIVGEPVYTFGGYDPATSAAGTYELSFTGLSAQFFDISVQPGSLTVITHADAKVFYWKHPYDFADFGNLDNWSYSADFSTAVDRLPCEADALWVNGVQKGANYYTGWFDLAGTAYEIGNYTRAGKAAEEWRRTHVDVTNGTLTIRDASFGDTLHSHEYQIWNGGVVVFAPTNEVLSVAQSGLTELMTVKCGGRVEMYNYPAFQNEINADTVTHKVEAGGTMVLDPYGISMTTYNEYGVVFENNGTMVLPHGLNWSATGYNNQFGSTDKDRFRLRQKAGTMLLGGDFRKTGKNVSMPGEMTFELAGGTLEVTNAVTFYTAESAYNEKQGFYEQVFAEMPANAAATVEVKVGSSIDFTPFAYGENASLVKNGPGQLIFGSQLPSNLTVNAAPVVFAEPTATTEPSTLTLGSTLQGEIELRVWKDSNEAVVNDAIDLAVDQEGDFVIKPRCYGFKPLPRVTIRLGAYPDGAELPAAKFAAPDWTFCRLSSDPNSLYLRFTPRGTRILVK